MQMTVGYKLIDAATGAEAKSWGGTWGECPGIPNPLILPNGDHVHASSLNVEYSGYMLTEWMMDEPPPRVPEVITPRQLRIVLLQQGLLPQVEAMVTSADAATQITWEYATEFRRNHEMLIAMAAQLGMTDEQLDHLFITASQL